MLIPYNPKWIDHPIYKENIWDYTGYTKNQIIGLSGCYGFRETFEDACYTISGAYPSINITIDYPPIFLDRTVNIEKGTIKNNLFVSDVMGTGIGLNVFKSQLDLAIRAGLKKITANAIAPLDEEDKASGYIVWAKLGFMMDKRSQMKFDELMKKHDRHEKIVQDMYLNVEMDKRNLKEGRVSGSEFWKTEGFRFDGIFFLEDGSDSLKYFDKYCKSKM